MKKNLGLMILFLISIKIVNSIDKHSTLKKLKKNKTRKSEIYLNSVGNEVKSNPILDKPPYTLQRCDQIVSIESEYIPDLNDYSIRENNYFTITAYHINRFSKKDINLLEQSILFGNSRNIPTEPIGAKNCLLIDGGEFEKSLLLCGKDDEEFLSLKQLLQSFDNCRAGISIGAVNTKNQSKDKIPSIIELNKKCGNDGKGVSPQKLLDNLETKRKESEKNDDSYWIPGGHSVPGAPKY